VACWTRVSDFNEFYCSVEKAHRLLTERFSLKGGEQQEKSFTGGAQKQKQEQLDKEQLEASKEILESSGHESDQDQDDDNVMEAFYASEDETAASFSNEQFLNDVLAQQEDEEPPNEPEELIVKQEIGVVEVQERRETRATRAKSKANQLLASKSPPAEKPTPAKRRGRSKSEKPDASVEDGTKNKRYVDYKKSMWEIDEKIAQHMRLTCSICHEGQETFLLLCKHMQQVHHRKGYAVCCNKKFYKRSFLTDHIDRHSNPEKFK